MTVARDLLADIFEEGFPNVGPDGRPYDYADAIVRRLDERGLRLCTAKALENGPDAFLLVRDEDVSGVSGTGIVAEGVSFTDGSAALRWTSAWPTSVVFHERGMDSIRAVHGHDGRTRVEWCVWEGGDTSHAFLETAANGTRVAQTDRVRVGWGRRDGKEYGHRWLVRVSRPPADDGFDWVELFADPEQTTSIIREEDR